MAAAMAVVLVYAAAELTHMMSSIYIYMIYRILYTCIFNIPTLFFFIILIEINILVQQRGMYLYLND